MRFLRRFRSLFRRRATEAEMAEEMRFHLEQRTADYAADGLAADQARLAAERRFGNTASIQEQARESWGWGGLERLLKDLQLGVRQLAKSPGFTLLAVVTLSLGIGGNTAMFSVANGVVLKPLPYPDTAQLDQIYRATAQQADGHVSAADFRELRLAADGYGEVGAYAVEGASLAEPGRPAEMATTSRVTANLLSILGIAPQLGRAFWVDEEAPGRDRVVILSQRLWLKRYAGAEDIIGRSVRIDGVPHLVIGVMPASFNDWRHLGWVDFFRPLALTDEQSADRQTASLRLIGRRSTGLAPAEAHDFIANFGARLAAAHPEVHAGSSWRTVPLQQVVAGNSGPTTLAMLIGLSGFVVIIACSNLANLLLARTMARAREFAVRAALGASRLQLLRPLVAEALLLASAGGVAAVLVAGWAADWLQARSTGDNGEQVVFTLDWSVLGWAFALSLLTAVAFGLAPALFALRLNLNDTLKSGGRGATGGRGHQRFRQVVIVGQFALAMVLLTGAGLFIRGLHDLNTRRSGWESAGLVSGNILLPAGNYADAEQMAAFHRRVIERLGTLPGVVSASVSSFAPFFNWHDIRKLVVAEREPPARGREPAAMFNAVSPDYFNTVGTRLLAGRAFTAADTAGSARVYVISESTGRALFGAENPLGRRLAVAGSEQPRWGEVVGVVSDVVSSEPEPGVVRNQVYQPLVQEPVRQAEIAVRVAGVAPVTLVDGIRRVMAELDPDLPVRDLRDADSRVNRANYQLGVLRDMLAAFAVLGLGLASLGIYGIIARTMAQRTGEFAVRLALGARVEDLTRLVLLSGVKLALAGSLLGLAGAFGVGRLLAAGFPGLRLSNSWALTAAMLLLVAVALLASWLPARRAAKVDAISALRAE